MNDYINKIKELLHRLNKKEATYEREGVRPKRDWQIILFVFTISLLFLAAAAGYFYLQVSTGKIFSVSAQESLDEIKINKALLNKTIGDINERSKSFEVIKQGGEAPIDPSV